MELGRWRRRDRGIHRSWLWLPNVYPFFQHLKARFEILLENRKIQWSPNRYKVPDLLSQYLSFLAAKTFECNWFFFCNVNDIYKVPEVNELFLLLSTSILVFTLWSPFKPLTKELKALWHSHITHMWISKVLLPPTLAENDFLSLFSPWSHSLDMEVYAWRIRTQTKCHLSFSSTHPSSD